MIIFQPVNQTEVGPSKLQHDPTQDSNKRNNPGWTENSQAEVSRAVQNSKKFHLTCSFELFVVAQGIYIVNPPQSL